MEKERIEEALIEEPETVPQSTWVLVGQFFVVPILIVALCVGVFVLFGLITGEGRTPRDYLEEVKAGKGSRRWQAAYELSKFLNQSTDEVNDPRFARSLSVAFQNAQDDDPRIRQYLALAMGRLGDPIAVQPLIDSLEQSDSQVQLYTIWALGELKDTRAVPPLLALLGSPDADLRKMVVYSLGIIADERAEPELKAALHDPQRDVRWNAALALARMGSRSGLQTLHQMLDRDHLETLEDVNPRQQSEAIINAIRGLVLLKDGSARPKIEELRSDEDVKVQAAAIEALSRLP